MFLLKLRKCLPSFPKVFTTTHIKKCHSVFGIKELIQQEKPENITIDHVKNSQHEEMIEAMKQHYLSEHVLVRARCMGLDHNKALDEYLYNLLEQGNSIYARSAAGALVGICVNFASSPVDPQNLRNYAFYRQDPNLKDFLYFTAKLQETPNLWKLYQAPKIFEVKMLAVIPEFRRQGLATMMVEKSKGIAKDQGCYVVRMDCINRYDYKVAEKCMLNCVARFPLHNLRGPRAPFIKSDSEFNRYMRVYAGATSQDVDFDVRDVRKEREELME